MRDAFQLISIAVSFYTLLLIFRRKRIYGERMIRDWLAFVVVSTLTITYYIAVIYDLHVQDIMISGDISSTLRLTSQIALMLYVLYHPHRMN